MKQRPSIVHLYSKLAAGWLSLALLGCNGESFYSPHAVSWNFYLYCGDCGGTTIPVGQSRRLYVDTRTFSAGTVGAIGSLSCPQMTWSSSSPGVASVSGGGKQGFVTGLSPGTVTITVEGDCLSAGRLSSSVDFEVMPAG